MFRGCFVALLIEDETIQMIHPDFSQTASRRSIMLLILLLSVCCYGASSADVDRPGEGSAEKRVTFYPTYGYRQNDEWVIPLRIWVHEAPGVMQRGLARAARAYIAGQAGIDQLSESDKALFERHSDDFFADSESGESVEFRFDDDPERRVYSLEHGDKGATTNLNGLLEGVVRLDEETAASLLTAQHSAQGWLRFHAVSDDHRGEGSARLIPPTGHSVISDIDDTIKITEIPAGKHVVLMNTFFREFAAVSCMAELYRSLGADVAFHYVSGSPWQMYQPLADFLFTDPAGFPEGSFHMKNVRMNMFEKETYEDIWAIVASGSQEATFDQKVSQIRTIMNRFPGRTFTLIGDSGEKDPEVFRLIRAEYPAQVREIRIRVVSEEDTTNPGRLENMTWIPADLSKGGSCQEFVEAAAN